MKRSCRNVRAGRRLSMFVVAGLVASAGVTNAIGQNGVFGSSLDAEKRQIFRLIAEHHMELVSLKAKVSIVMRTEKLGVAPIKQTGKVKFVAAKDNSSAITRVVLKKPREIVSISNGDYTVYKPDLKVAFIGRVTNGTANAVRAGIFKLLFSTPDEYQDRFRSVYLGRTTISGGIPVNQLILSPLEEATSKSFELSVDMAGMPLQVRIYEKNGDSTTLSLTKIGYNKKIDRSKLVVKFKKGTKIVREEPPAPIPAKLPEPVLPTEPPTARPVEGSIVIQILGRMDKHNKALTTLRANVTIVQDNRQIGDQDKFTGSVIYARPRLPGRFLVRVDFISPRETLALVNEQYLIYRPNLNQAFVGSLARLDTKIGGKLALLSISRTELRANFILVYLGEAILTNGTRTWHLQITPKTRKDFQRAEIWVDGNGMPLQLKVIKHNNDSTTVTLSNLQKNVGVNGRDFRIDLPKGTKIIKE